MRPAKCSSRPATRSVTSIFERGPFDTTQYGSSRRLDQGRRAVDRLEPGLELRRHVGPKLVLEVVGQPALPALLDVAQVVGHARPGEPRERLLDPEAGAEPGRELDDALDRDPLAVDEHPVAVEQHRFDSALADVAWRRPVLLR